MKQTPDLRGHGAALLAVFIWGTTFISTKVLLTDFTPIGILFVRFAISVAVLYAVTAGKRMKGVTRKEDKYFAVAGLCGITLYYLMENISLELTTAANCSVIVSTAPFFTALVVCLASRGQKKLSVPFCIGFVCAIAGICLISFEDMSAKGSVLGDLLALAAAIVWAFYSVLMRKIGTFGYPVLLTTRRIFTWGILFMLPLLALPQARINFSALWTWQSIGNYAFLGIGAGALCFTAWNTAVERLGPVRTSVYIYLVPVITLVSSALLLHEPMKPAAIVGTVLTLAGLALSELWPNMHKRGAANADGPAG